jgi:hypothetical protein
MRKASATFLWAIVLGACEMDLTGLGDAFDWDPDPDLGGSINLTPQMLVAGNVAVGGYAALQDEVVVELWDPADPIAPVDTMALTGSRYFFNLGSSPSNTVCTYQVRGRRWDGATTAMQPLFPPTAPCVVVPTMMAGTAIELPAYAPLPEPFVLEGEVFVDGRPADSSTQIEVLVRALDGSRASERIEVGVGGRYRIETRDGAQRYAYCATPQVRGVDPSGRAEVTDLSSVPIEHCGGRRVLPDLRFGAVKAASGVVYLGDPASGVRVGAGEAWAELLRATDRVVVGEKVTTFDDGTFHLWFPAEMREPGCDWLLRVTHAGGGSELRGYPSSGCTFPAVHHVTFMNPRSGDPELLELVVQDPVGDQTGASDIVEFRLRFDPETGEYQIEIEADAAHPFDGEMRININLYNPAKSSFFSDAMNDVVLSASMTKLTLSGSHPELRKWAVGDSVHTNSLGGTPNPPGASLYRSGVTHFPMGFLTNEDVIAFEDVRTPGVVTAVE